MFKKGLLRLEPNRVRRLYTGGWLVDRFLKQKEPSDGFFPENWVGSTVRARSFGQQQTGMEGLSFGVSADGGRFLLKDLLEQDPARMLGEDHYRKYGANPGILVKLLDASVRLPIQVHPDKSMAMKYFNSPFGKTEAWLVLGTREINGTHPYILLGFKKGVSREQFIAAVKENNTLALEQCLHRVPVKVGEVYLIESGVPHAIGQGSLILEIQEPTDFTIYAEKRAGDVAFPNEVAYMGLTLDQSLECYHFEPVERNKLLGKYQLKPTLIQERAGQGREEWLISYRDTSCFALRLLRVDSFWEVEERGSFHLTLVLRGKGRLKSEGATIEIEQGDSFFVPAGVSYRVDNLTSEPVEIVTCWPPQ